MSVLPQTPLSAAEAVQRCIESDCRATFSINKKLYICSQCGGLLDIELNQEHIGELANLPRTWLARRASLAAEFRSGVWRFRELLPFGAATEVISLDEGNTPLYDAPRSAEYCGIQSLKLKHQGCNPTGSFKDTGMTTAVTQAMRLKAELLVCASTGNTAASLAAYAARANLACGIIVPQGQVSHAKLAQSLDYGAIVIEIEGNFDDAMRVIRQLSDHDSIYLVNSINPFRIEGQKTVVAEMLEQLSWEVPDHVVVPGGNLGNCSAFGKAFHELVDFSLIHRMPRISVVQADGAAPFARLFEHQEKYEANAEFPLEIETVKQPSTLASAIRIGAPVSWRKAWRAIRQSRGYVLRVSEQEIADAKAMIGRDGIGCEPASATTVAGIRRMVQTGRIDKDEKVVGVLTGHLLKDTDYVTRYHSGYLKTMDDVEQEVVIGGTYANRPLRVSADPDTVLKALLDKGERLR